MKQRKMQFADDCGECLGLCNPDSCNCPHHFPDPDEEVYDSIDFPPFKDKNSSDVEEEDI